MEEFEKKVASADNGDVTAQEAVATAYFKGKVVPKDLDKAMIYFEKAAQNGSGMACYQLGHACETGTGAPMNLGKAKAYYQKSADLGYQNAINKLAAFDATVPTQPIAPQPMTSAYSAPSTPTNTVAAVGSKTQSTDRKSKVVAILLALFLGAFGIHSFYLGYTKKGIIQLLLCWTGISCFWAIVDLVRLATGGIPCDGNGIQLK